MIRVAMFVGIVSLAAIGVGAQNPMCPESLPGFVPGPSVPVIFTPAPPPTPPRGAGGVATPTSGGPEGAAGTTPRPADGTGARGTTTTGGTSTGGRTAPAGPLPTRPGYGATPAPGAAGGTTPGLPGGSTPGGRKMGGSFESAVTWEWWWKYNSGEFLDVRKFNAPVTTSTADASNAEALAAKRRRTADLTRVSTIPFLRAGVLDRNDGVRASAILALGKCGDLASESLLLAALSDASPEVRENACMALGLLATEGGRKALVGLATDAKSVAQWTGQAKSVPLDLRIHACLGIGLVGHRVGANSDEAAALMDLLTRKNPNVDLNVAAAFALGMAKSSAAVPDLLRIAADPTVNDVLRSTAATALGRIGDRSALPATIDLLEAKSLHVRRAAAIALGELAIGDELGVVDVLGGRVKSAKDDAERRFAIMSLGRIGGKKAVERLSAVLDGRDAGDASFAAIALAIAAGVDPALDKKWIGARIHAGLAKAKSCETIGAYAIACGILGYREAAKDILAVLESDAHGHLRADCAQALGLMQYRGAIPTLTNFVRDEDQPAVVRNASMQTLSLLGDDSTIALMTRLIDESGGSVLAGGATLRGLGLMKDGRAVVEIGRTLRGDGDRPDVVRASAAWALGFLGDKDDISPIRTFGRSENYVSQSGVLADILAKSIF